ncbi:flavin containing amine oxidoreductase [Fusarium oxysporum f. sp. phaseoli]
MRQTWKSLADTLPRTFQLFQYIGITQESKPGLIPSYLKDELDECPVYINDITTRGNVWDPKKKADDPLLQTNSGDLVNVALKVFTDVAKEKFEAAIAEEKEEEKQAFKSAGPKLPVEDDFPKGPGYNYNTIDYLETMTYSLLVAVQVVQLRRERKAGKYTAMKIKTTRTDPKTKKVETKDREYFAIFNSTTLGALQRMELSDAGLSWGTKQAIRALGYGASAKVGMKFRTAWWQTDPFNIAKGGVSRTDLPSNEGEDKWDPEKPAVLLCSYTWGQDAQRIGSLCSNNTTQDDAELKRLIIHDLARLHARRERPFEEMVKFLEEQYIDHHGYDWYRDQNMSGAFAYFGPGQFSNMWQEIIKPNALGQLYLVGEAASSHHAWIVGALESVVRAVYVMFQGLQNGNEKFEAYDIVLKLLRTGPDNGKNVSEPLKKDGDMPTGLPFHPLPEEMPTRQFYTTKDKDLTASPEKEANEEGVDMTYGAALAVLSLIESFYELGVDKNDTY